MPKNRMLNRHKPLPPTDVLFSAAREFFNYQENGTLIYTKDPRRPHCATSKVIGKEVGGDDGHGYLMCMLLGHKFKVHQIVWLWHHGALPSVSIDHADRDRRNNRINNLRLASDLENFQNLTAATAPLAGSAAVTGRRGFAARVQVNGKKHYLGYFLTREEANAAYTVGKRRLAGKFSPV